MPASRHKAFCWPRFAAVPGSSVCASPVLWALRAAALDFLTVCPRCSNLTFGERPRQPNPHLPSVHPELRSDGIRGSSFLVPLPHHGHDPGQDLSLAVTVLVGISRRALGMVHRRWLCLCISRGCVLGCLASPAIALNGEGLEALTHFKYGWIKWVA